MEQDNQISTNFEWTQNGGGGPEKGIQAIREYLQFRLAKEHDTLQFIHKICQLVLSSRTLQYSIHFLALSSSIYF
jgi:hypothetical protein